jgi:hypothetical protein
MLLAAMLPAVVAGAIVSPVAPPTRDDAQDALDAPPARCTSCKGPVWSWDTFPAFFHGSDPNGTAGGGFTAAALATITRFPMVTLEKWQGASIEPYTWEEDAWVAGRNRWGVQGAHLMPLGLFLNPLGLFLNPLGLFLRTSIPYSWRNLSAFLPA